MADRVLSAKLKLGSKGRAITACICGLTVSVTGIARAPVFRRDLTKPIRPSPANIIA